MRVPLKWLADYVDLRLPVKELAHRLTMSGTEVDAILSTGGDWDLISVAQVMAVERHPNADRLTLTTVSLSGGERMTVVCGAPNVAVGQKVAFARTGARLIDGHTGEPTVLRAARIRGVESAGMVCSEKELGLSDYHEGILVLPEDAPVGTPLAEYLADTIFDLEVTPNRPDCLSVLGVAREVAALTAAWGGSTSGEAGAVAVREPPRTYAEEGPPIRERVSVEIADPDLCYRYVATLVEGVKIGPSPAWMQERLTAAGMRPINNIVDITNYVMLELGQPLHAFDFDRISQGKIIVRRVRPGELLRTLDGVQRRLEPDMLAIADASGAVALAGVMGGAESEVSDTTTNILLEAANFNNVSIRRTSNALKMHSEASSRFDKGLSPELSAIAARRATKLIVELAGGRAAHGTVDVYPGKAPEIHTEVRRARILQVLGIDPPTSQVRNILTALGFGCRWQPPDIYKVRVPYWRTDIHIPDDVVEEVGRIIGYEQIPVGLVRGAIPSAPFQPLRELREQVRDALAAAGMQEVITYSLTTMEAVQRVVSPEALAASPPLRMANPMSSEYEWLRPTLRASLLRTLAANERQHEGPLALYEVARVYLSRDQDLPQEPEHAAGVVGGRRLDRWGHVTEEPLDFFDAKGYLEYLFAHLRVTPTFEEGEEFVFVPGRTARIKLGERAVGVLGQVDPRVATEFDIDGEVFLFELVLDEVLAALEAVRGGQARRYEPVPRFPPVVQDLAVVVDEAVTAAQVQSLIEGTPLVRWARLFDVYTGDPIPAGKKSLAFSVTYQSPEHTLTDAEVARAHRGIVERLKRQLGATLRG
jgi:phenylalanyl-tRNA synthetase beta chain